jgi:putative aldouronate transport system permease protein
MREIFGFKKGLAARSIFRICNFLFMACLLFVIMVPLMKVISDSLDRSTNYGLNFWPKNFSIEAYKSIFTNKSLFMPLIISIITTVGGTVTGLIITTLGAYVLCQKKLIGRAFFSKFVFITMIFNGGLIPTFLVLKGVGMVDTLWAVILPSAINVFNLILMRNFFEQIPESLYEAAEMDGATPPQVFTMIVLPMSKAALASIGLFFAVQYWNEFFQYVIYISNTDLYNFQIKLRDLVLSDQNIMDPSIIGFSNTVKNAAVIVAMLPFFVVYPFAQRYFITGVTMGAVKE